MKKLLSSLVVAGVVTVLGLAPAQAVPVIDFAGQSNGGTLTFVGGNIIGTDIPITSLLVTGAPQNDGQTILPAGVVLDFNTATGEISVTEETDAIDYDWFLRGTISSFTNLQSGNVLSFQGTGVDVKNPDFLAFYGIPDDQPFAFFGFSFQATVIEGELVSNSTDITNTAVPEPGTMLLLGTGLLGLGLMRRRKQSRG